MNERNDPINTCHALLLKGAKWTIMVATVFPRTHLLIYFSKETLSDVCNLIVEGWRVVVVVVWVEEAEQVPLWQIGAVISGWRGNGLRAFFFDH